MLGKSKTRLTRGLLLVVYFLATTTAALFHDHSAPGDHDHTIGLAADGNGPMGDHFAASGSCHAGEAVGSGGALPCSGTSSDDGCPASADDCAVCRFLGLCSLPIAPPPMVASHDLLVMANPAEPIHESRPLDRTIHSRAPPRLA
jgi:hypothetical protein